MVENLDKSFELASALTALSNQKRILYEEYQQSLLYFYNGGTFKINKELISFLNVLKSNNNDTCVLIDDNSLPIEIENIANFLATVLDQYSRCSNLYLAKYQTLKNQKNLSSILDL